MTTSNRRIVASLFKEEANAQQAIAELQQAGFRDDQIKYSVHRDGGGIMDSLLSMGMPQDEADYFNRVFQTGRTVVTVQTSDRQQEAYDILTRFGGYDSSSRAGQASTYATTGTTTDQGYAQQGQYANQADYADTDERRRLQLREERLQAEKRTVQAGEVGLHKEVIAEQQSVNVPVTHEEVYIESHPVSGQVSDAPIGTDESIRVPVREEQVDVTKQTVATGEVSLGKRQVTENQQFTDTVRREEARLDRTGDVNVQGDQLPPTTDTTTNR